MKEIVIASGKGGVGKTTVAASLAVFLAKAGTKIVAADADVDAPDLLLALGGGKTISSTEIEASEKAVVDGSKCTGCGNCVSACPFGAIVVQNRRPTVVRLMCEGCGVCEVVCPVNAVEVKKAVTGTLKIEDTKYGFPLVTGYLRLGEHNSGHLVASVKKSGRKTAEDLGARALVVDAAPGIGCPVIASISGASYVIAVTEPTPAAKRDLERLVKIIKHFGVSAGVVINKANLSDDFRDALEDWVKHVLGYQILGEIPIDYEVVKALVNMVPVTEFNPNAEASKILTAIAKRVRDEVLL
ncbi:MAG: ATP-binding protein [Candidatus Hodarchaeaceae archaeon]|nr:ATP-binding protein [Candidatus Hodarchaeaceae archaeon]